MLVLSVVLVGTAGCDKLFGLEDLRGEVPIDASVLDANGLDTSGWPTNGNVDPKPCPVSGLDEDADAMFDDCDNCPADANLDQIDSDRDGVGDVCDPHPQFAVERLAAFYAFDTLQGTQITGAGQYIIQNGALFQRGPSAQRTLFVVDGGPWREPSVEVKMTGLSRAQLETTDFFAGVALVFTGAPTTVTPDQLNCRSHHYGAGRVHLELARLITNASGGATDIPYSATGTDVTIVITSARHGSEPRCDGARGEASPSSLTEHLVLAEHDEDVASPWVGVWTMNAKAFFTSLVVYETIWP